MEDNHTRIALMVLANVRSSEKSDGRAHEYDSIYIRHTGKPMKVTPVA